MEGWISIHRQVIERGWLKDHRLWVLWCYLLLKATHKPYTETITIRKNNGVFTERVLLNPGQLIFGRKKASLDTGISEQSIRTSLRKLQHFGNIIVKSTKNYSVITITNFCTYQGIINNDQPSINQVSTTDNNIIHNNKLGFSLIELIEKESSVYSVIKKYENILGKEKVTSIFSGCISRGQSFKTVSNLSAYLQTCVKTSVTDSLPELKEGQEGWI